jgi:hypothetical protein
VSAYEPPADLDRDTRALYKAFNRLTGLIPSARRNDHSDAFETMKHDPAALTDQHLRDMACLFPEDAIKASEARERARRGLPVRTESKEQRAATEPRYPRHSMAHMTIERCATSIAKAIETATDPLLNRIIELEYNVKVLRGEPTPVQDKGKPHVRYKGDWNQRLEYTVDDAVMKDGVLYVCTMGYARSTPGVDSLSWMRLGQRQGKAA